MARLIEVQNAQPAPARLVLRVGDVLQFHAAGGRVQSGSDVLQLLGVLQTAVLGDQGDVLTPMGPPNTVLFRALRTGQALIDVVAGDPWQSSQTISLTIRVEG